MTRKSRRTLEVARTVADVLARHQVETAVIGAVAMAAHAYPRATNDLDLATCTDPNVQLRAVAEELRAAGFKVEFREPDYGDPLGGVIDVRPKRGTVLVQVVNYHTPFRGSVLVAADAIRTAFDAADVALRVVDLAHLIALKLYGGGPQNDADIIALLTRNPGADRNAIRELCARFRLAKQFDRVLALLPK